MASNNSSKTAHVMNLLSKNRPSAEAEAAPAETAPAGAPAQEPALQAAPAAPAAPILTSINEDAAVSSQIKDALEAELSGEAPVQESPALPEEAPAPELTAETQVAAALEAEAPDSEAARQESAEIQAKFAARAEAHDGNSYVNVMQILVDEKADKYMQMFGLCCCDRCKADVRAYALNRLPPKYVFMGKSEMVPRLTVYENKYSSDIVAQLLNACRVIMETPHHTR